LDVGPVEDGGAGIFEIAGDGDQGFGVADRRRAEKEGIDDAEDGAVQADAGGER
jgi:hypothetical protein